MRFKQKDYLTRHILSHEHRKPSLLAGIDKYVKQRTFVTGN
jgi:hypothetical protein